jgi:6-phosphogluconolactonase (cycloisomerase 2 family)
VKHVRIGGYGPGIVTIGGGLTRVTAPSFLAAHPSLPVLYAVGELERGWLTAYQAQGAELGPLDERPSEGHSPCHVAVDPEGGLLAVANYGDGTATLYRLDERGAFTGDPIVLRHTGSGPDAERQEGPHAHQAVFHDGLLHVSDLGTDEIRRYRHDGTPLEPITLAPGTGPRHFAFAGSRLYVAGELDGDLVYVANRGPNTISVLRAADLSPVAEVPSGGNWPRHFAIDGERMYVANQYANTVTSFRIEDGVPAPDGESYEVESPACVLIM